MTLNDNITKKISCQTPYNQTHKNKNLKNILKRWAVKQTKIRAWEIYKKDELSNTLQSNKRK